LWWKAAFVAKGFTCAQSNRRGDDFDPFWGTEVGDHFGLAVIHRYFPEYDPAIKPR
jgi:hypothetical protein